MDDRLTKLRALLKRENLDALLVSGPVDDVTGRHSANRRYVSGFTGSAGWALVTMDSAFAVVDGRYTQQAEQECGARGFRVYPTNGRMGDWLPGLAKAARLGGSKLGISRADMTLGGYLALRAGVTGLPKKRRPKLVPAGPLVERLRRLKDRAEMAALERAIDIADRAYERVLSQLRPGLLETEVAAMVQGAVSDLGGDGLAFSTIVASGARGALPHATPQPLPIEAGASVTIDMGALVDGYCSDLTRTFVAGSPDGKFDDVYGVVAAAQRAAIAGIRPGMTGKEAHALAQDVIDSAGYGEQFVHGLGHGIGLDVHEFPHLGKVSEDVLKAGMVFTIEPGIYVPGWGGVRIEDVVVLEADGPRVLSRAQKYEPTGVQG